MRRRLGRPIEPHCRQRKRAPAIRRSRSRGVLASISRLLDLALDQRVDPRRVEVDELLRRCPRQACLGEARLVDRHALGDGKRLVGDRRGGSSSGAPGSSPCSAGIASRDSGREEGGAAAAGSVAGAR